MQPKFTFFLVACCVLCSCTYNKYVHANVERATAATCRTRKCCKYECGGNKLLFACKSSGNGKINVCRYFRYNSCTSYTHTHTCILQTDVCVYAYFSFFGFQHECHHHFLIDIKNIARAFTYFQRTGHVLHTQREFSSSARIALPPHSP